MLRTGTGCVARGAHVREYLSGVRRFLASLLLTTGCYAEFGLGYGGQSYATAHGSMGVVVHFDEDREVGSLRVGGGGAIAGFSSPVRTGTLFPGPAVFGGHARILGRGPDSLVVSGDVHEPHGGSVHVEMPTSIEQGLTTRAFAGLGYRHKWSQVPKLGHDEVERAAASVITAIGPELFLARTDYIGSSTSIGGAFSVVFTMRGWVLWEMFECLSSKACDD